VKRRSRIKANSSSAEDRKGCTTGLFIILRIVTAFPGFNASNLNMTARSTSPCPRAAMLAA